MNRHYQYDESNSPNHYLKQGNTFYVQSKESLDIHGKLPARNFIVKYDQLRGCYFLEGVEAFTLPDQLYGKIVRQSDRIMNTFAQRPLSTGVFLEGEKGSGKTLLAKVLSTRVANELEGPTLIINQALCGDLFNKFIQDINQPCVVLFDEFEKVYCDQEEQDQILTLLDGVFPSKKLFILTCNDKYKVNDKMKNRPGRLFYMLSFDGLDKEFIIEYCNKNLKQSLHEHIPQVVSISETVNKFNFDMLKSLVEEMNRYDEAPKHSVEMLNIKPDEFVNDMYHLSYFDPDGVAIPSNEMMDSTWHGNLSGDNFYIDNYRYFDNGDEYDEVPSVNSVDGNGTALINAVKQFATNKQEEVHIQHTEDDFVRFDIKERSAIFKNEEGYRLVVSKKQRKKKGVFSYDYL